MKIDQTTIKLLISGLDELEASDSVRAIDWCTNIPSLEAKRDETGVDLFAREIDREFEIYREKIAELKSNLWNTLHTVRQDEAIKRLMEDIK